MGEGWCREDRRSTDTGEKGKNGYGVKGLYEVSTREEGGVQTRCDLHSVPHLVTQFTNNRDNGTVSID